MRADPKQLERPPWSALTATHSSFALGNDLARRYQPAVAPMAAIRDVSEECLLALQAIMEPGDIVGLFGAEPVAAIDALKVIANMTVEQMVYAGSGALAASGEPATLGPADVPEMMQLVELTKPGPFFPRTIELGSYIGIRSGGRLIAMAGERMRFPGFTEISAVCTHPDHRGRGYSTSLVHTLMRAIRDRGETPFLHVFTENRHAAALYDKLGFVHRRSLAVTVLKRPT
jgi:ribosomal protein S18 acetylase RimI-like enzyme